MTATAIRVQNLGKQYKLGLRADAKRSFGEALLHGLGAPLRRLRNLGERSNADDLFWALRGVSFEVQQGDVIGVIGRNGAGKSTLLKVLSRITSPTTGRVELRGSVRSLLEIGTGFHPELTGRENIYLNGAILGMKKAEIDAHFDQIVAFAEIDRFLDTPVKRYSSGMYVRLAFAVAAHLEPEVLIVDEVLAVGDAAFQRKCLGKMSDVAGAGRTVLFVSHNMTAVRNLCSRAICIEGGRVVQDGECTSVIHQYLSENVGVDSAPEMDLHDWPARKGNGQARVFHARLLNQQAQVSGVFNRLGPMTIEFTFESHSRSRLNYSAICTTPDDGVKVLQLAHQDTPGFEPGVVEGRRTIRINIPSLPLQCGDYQWDLCIHTDSITPMDVVFEVLRFSVEDDLSLSPRPYRSTRINGLCSLEAHWEYIKSEAPVNALK